MTKSETRKARKTARTEGQPLVGELAMDRGPGAEFTESAKGYRARDRWARRYNDLNGAPENDDDR